MPGLHVYLLGARSEQPTADAPLMTLQLPGVRHSLLPSRRRPSLHLFQSGLILYTNAVISDKR